MTTRFLSAILLTAFVLPAAPQAQAQLGPAIAGCAELREGARKAQADACVAYAPCNTVLQAYGTCEKATAFMDRLRSFTNGTQELTAEVVFEANAPDNKFDEQWQEQFRQMRETMRGAGKERLAGKSSRGVPWTYEGGVQEGKMHGLGTQFWADGNAFRGRFDAGIATGPGDYAAANGHRATGEYRRNELGGNGLRRDRSGNVSKGSFVDGKMQGRGELLFANGHKYEGMIKDDQRDGPGTYTWPDGSSYTGGWRNNARDGQGTSKDALGNTRARTYAAGKLVGADSTEIDLHALKLIQQAEQRAMERCDDKGGALQVPVYNFATMQEENGRATVAIDWKGGCAEGKRDGEGVLTWTSERSIAFVRVALTFEARGSFVRGRRVGLWCITDFRFARNGKHEPPGIDHRSCAVLGGHTRPLTFPYRKRWNGTWVQWIDGVQGEQTLAAGALEAQGVKVLADAMAGKTELKARLAGTATIMEDLLAGAKIALAPDPAPIDLQGQRVAIVLSSRAIAEMERFKRERQALIAASAGLSGDAAAERQKFIERSNLDRWLGKVLVLVKSKAKAAAVEEDLAGLQQGRFDYALVLDWRSQTRFDLLGKFDRFPPEQSIGAESFQAYLVDRELQAVKHVPPWPRTLAPKERMSFPALSKGDHAYLGGLASFFGRCWGDTPEERGGTLVTLAMMLNGGY